MQDCMLKVWLWCGLCSTQQESMLQCQTSCFGDCSVTPQFLPTPQHNPCWNKLALVVLAAVVSYRWNWRGVKQNKAQWDPVAWLNLSRHQTSVACYPLWLLHFSFHHSIKMKTHTLTFHCVQFKCINVNFEAWWLPGERMFLGNEIIRDELNWNDFHAFGAPFTCFWFECISSIDVMPTPWVHWPNQACVLSTVHCWSKNISWSCHWSGHEVSCDESLQWHKLKMNSSFGDCN